jgi:outer membrane immunogenic protein
MERSVRKVFDPADGAAPLSTSFRSSGALGGLQLGYNWQFNGNWLVGVETDFDWSGMKGSSSNTSVIFPPPLLAAPFTGTVDEQIKWFGTVRARLGYLPMNNLLTYITGGFAYGRVEQSGSYVNNGVGTLGISEKGSSILCPGGGVTCFAGSSSRVATGWTLGGGFEYALWQNVTFKAEYLYVSLSSKSIIETATAVAVAGLTPASFNANYSNTNVNVARVGFNYRF